ncbi:MAG: MlaD family protein [Dissulfurispiraceae bacterium]
MTTYLKEEIKAGIIIVAAFLVLSIFTILIGGGQFFEKFDTYYIKVMNAAGLEVGSKVKLGGVRVGRVLNIKAPDAPGGPVLIGIGVKSGLPLYRGTTALITQIGFVGDIYLLLSIDKTTNERLKVGDVIPSEEYVDFAKLLARLDGISQSVEGLIKDVNLLFSKKNIHGIETLIENVNKLTISGAANLDDIAASLRKTSDKLQRVLNEVEELVSDNKGEISQMIKKARGDLEKAGDMIKTLEQTAKSVDQTSKSIDRAVNLQSDNIGNLLDTMTKTTEDLRDLLQEIKNKPWSIIYKESGKEE